MTHIVTGGGGFIGSHLVDALVARGEEVKIIDNFSRGDYGNIANAVRTGRAHVFQLNLERYGFPIRPDDVVWHLAAKVAGIEYNRQNQYEMLRANMVMNYQVIESVAKQRPRLFVFVSSSCIYPSDAQVPTQEWEGDVGNPERTNHGYAVAKWVGEQMVKHLHMEHNVPCVIVRPTNMVGLRDHYDKENSHVIPALIRRVMEGENPLVVWGSGQQSRTFLDARDAAKVLVDLHDYVMRPGTQYEGKEQPLVVTNIGHQQEVSIAELTEMVVRACGKDVGYTFDTSKPDGHKRRALDLSKMKALIGYAPNRPLVETITAMVEEYKEGRAHL